MSIAPDIAFSEIIPDILKLKDICVENSTIEKKLYIEKKVNRGLRDVNGKGVLTGLTEISEIYSKIIVDGKEVPCDGKLFYRGIDIEKLVEGFVKEKRFGFEEVSYLLIMGKLPNKEELNGFNEILGRYRSLPPSFVRDVIMKAPSLNMMNALARSVLTLYSYDDKADDISVENVMRQCLSLTAQFPLLSVYGYQAYDHYYNGNRLIIHTPQPEL